MTVKLLSAMRCRGIQVLNLQVPCRALLEGIQPAFSSAEARLCTSQSIGMEMGTRRTVPYLAESALVMRRTILNLDESAVVMRHARGELFQCCSVALLFLISSTEMLADLVVDLANSIIEPTDGLKHGLHVVQLILLQIHPSPSISSFPKQRSNVHIHLLQAPARRIR